MGPEPSPTGSQQPAARRIYICGPSGSGKSTLARRIGAISGLGVVDLDQLYRVGGGNGPRRLPHEREALVAQVLARPGWIAEGIHVGWTDGLMESADLIVWLDHVSAGGAGRRIALRFVAGALESIRRERGLRKVVRIGDYRRELGSLLRSLREARAHRRGGRAGIESAPTHQELAGALAPYATKVERCRSEGDIARLMARLSAERPTKAPGGPARGSR